MHSLRADTVRSNVCFPASSSISSRPAPFGCAFGATCASRRRASILSRNATSASINSACVDASGRASPTLRFLEAIGSAKPAAIEIGIDQAYATAVFEKPEDASTDWLGVVHAPTPPGSSRFGVLLPIEGRRWSVSLGVNHGEAPPGDIDAFMAFAKSFRLPTIYNAIRGAKRVGDIARFGMACSVLRAFDKLGRFPRGLVPLGDSVCRFPPVGGQGMSVVAQECCVLRPPDFETRIQYARALMRLAAEDYETDRIVFEVRALLKPQSALREPELASRVMSMMVVA